MVVAHNLTAINANRQLNIVYENLKKSTEKMSSGYKINRAADDAAGLAISEKMRRQIRGLNKGIENAEDGISKCLRVIKSTVRRMMPQAWLFQKKCGDRFGD